MMNSQSTNSIGEVALEADRVSLTYRVRRPYGLFLRSPSQKSAVRIRALQDVSLTCRVGEVIGIIGNNGAGKSTLCLTLAGILQPDSGEVRAHAHVSCLLSVGSGFAKDLTGRQNIFINCAILGLSRAEATERVDEIIRFSGLEDAIDNPLGTYSTGMRARLSFSIATTIEPEILLLDEALGGGDQPFRKKAKARVLELMERSKSIVMVSHSLGMIASMCHQVLWLDKGNARMFGPTDEVIDAYKKEQTSDD